MTLISVARQLVLLAMDCQHELYREELLALACIIRKSCPDNDVQPEDAKKVRGYGKIDKEDSLNRAILTTKVVYESMPLSHTVDCDGFLAIKRRFRDHINVKTFLCHVLRSRFEFRLREIGHVFGNDHTSIIARVRTGDNLIAVRDPYMIEAYRSFDANLTAIEATISLKCSE